MASSRNMNNLATQAAGLVLRGGPMVRSPLATTSIYSHADDEALTLRFQYIGTALVDRMERLRRVISRFRAQQSQNFTLRMEENITILKKELVRHELELEERARLGATLRGNEAVVNPPEELPRESFASTRTSTKSSKENTPKPLPVEHVHSLPGAAFPFETKLNPDVRRIIYDCILSITHTINVSKHKSQSYDFHRLAKAFPAIRQEIKHWMKQQTSHGVFGVLNPRTTIFACPNIPEAQAHLDHAVFLEEEQEMVYNLRIVGTREENWNHLLTTTLPDVLKRMPNLCRLELVFPKTSNAKTALAIKRCSENTKEKGTWLNSEWRGHTLILEGQSSITDGIAAVGEELWWWEY